MPTSPPTMPAKIISNHAFTKNIGPAAAALANRARIIPAGLPWPATCWPAQPRRRWPPGTRRSREAADEIDTDVLSGDIAPAILAAACAAAGLLVVAVGHVRQWR